MDDDPDSRRMRDEEVRYWVPRAVAIGLGLLVLIAGFWSSGRETVAFLANWSTFCIQAGVIYLFVFEREFLANLLIDILDFIKRVREYRERRAAQRAAAQEAKRHARASSQSANVAATETQDRGPPSPVNAPLATPPPAPPPLPVLSPLLHEPRPRFTSRDPAFGMRAFVGLIFAAVIGLLIFFPRERVGLEENEAVQDRPGEEQQPSSTPSTSPRQITSPSTYTVREGDSCWSIALRATQRSRLPTTAIWLALVDANPDLCSLDRERVLRPGAVLTVRPGESPATSGDQP